MAIVMATMNERGERDRGDVHVGSLWYYFFVEQRIDVAFDVDFAPPPSPHCALDLRVCTITITITIAIDSISTSLHCDMIGS